MNNNNYFHPSVSVSAIDTLFKSNFIVNNEIHSIEVYENNEMVVRFAPQPYDCSVKSEVYSLSKSFTSTAIGLAVDEGLLSVDDFVIDFFPDKLPQTVSENLANMKVNHLLSMNTGHATCVMSHIFDSEDGVKSFFEQQVVYMPGTNFAYNSGASYMLSAIISKLTGYSLLDYLSIKLLNPMGINNVSWSKCGGDICQGCTGITVSCDDIAKIGLLYLNNGVWAGKKLLSSDWVKTASSFHSDTRSNGTPDWESGYGYHFWINSRDGFRGDGAYGQLCVILPKTKIVVTILAEASNMQAEIDSTYELVKALHANTFKDDIERFMKYPVLETGQGKFDFENEYFTCLENAMGISWMSVSKKCNTLEFRFSNETEDQAIVAGNGYWIVNEFYAKMMKPKLTDIMSSSKSKKIRLAACFNIVNGKIEMLCRHLNTPHKESILIERIGVNLVVNFKFNFSLLSDKAIMLTGVPFSNSF